jgi:hypothetical protein
MVNGDPASLRACDKSPITDHDSPKKNALSEERAFSINSNA